MCDSGRSGRFLVAREFVWLEVGPSQTGSSAKLKRCVGVCADLSAQSDRRADRTDDLA